MGLPKGVSGNPKGRPPGLKNKLTQENVARARETGLLPHEMLLEIARGVMQIEKSINPETGEVKEHKVYPTLDVRIQCMQIAAPYYAPKQANVQHQVTDRRDPNKIRDEVLLDIALGDGQDDKPEG